MITSSTYLKLKNLQHAWMLSHYSKYLKGTSNILNTHLKKEMEVFYFWNLLSLLIKNMARRPYLINNLISYVCVIMLSLWSNGIKFVKEQQHCPTVATIAKMSCTCCWSQQTQYKLLSLLLNVTKHYFYLPLTFKHLSWNHHLFFHAHPWSMYILI